MTAREELVGEGGRGGGPDDDENLDTEARLIKDKRGIGSGEELKKTPLKYFS
jgi:hypothetical protein